jgi:hypothetical protein
MTDTFPATQRDTVPRSTQLDRRNPVGSNSLDSLAMYFQRILYKEEIYPPGLFTPLDTWYNKLYYGRVDQLQNSITADFNSLVTIPSTAKPNVFALNFVVDAFEDLVSHLKNARIMGVIVGSGNDKIYDMKAYRAYTDPTAIYGEYLQELYEAFNSSILKEKKNTLVDLKTFAQEYMSFLKKMSAVIPVTKTNYLLTPMFNVTNSGLSIAVDTGPAQDDAYKYENWIADPNFKFYANSAKKFGFSVNKNIPWILTADLFSNASLKYMRRYVNDDQEIIDEKNFFDAYFTKTFLTDITDLKNFIVNSYKLFIKTSPYYEHRAYLPKCDKYTIETPLRAHAFQITDRNTPIIIPELSINQALTDKMMLDFYLDLRASESENSVRVTKKLRTELANIYRLQPNKTLTPMQNAAAYINLIYRDFIYGVDYLALHDTLFQDLLDNQVRTGKITTAGSIIQQLY